MSREVSQGRYHPQRGEIRRSRRGEERVFSKTERQEVNLQPKSPRRGFDLRVGCDKASMRHGNDRLGRPKQAGAE